MPGFGAEEEERARALTDIRSGQPLVSFLVITYNQERFVAEAIESALSQTYDPLEIVFSDDCSTDRTYEIISDKVAGYGGSHTIVLNRNRQNLGIAGNINSAFALARGGFFVMAAGDDISAPDRTGLLVQRWQGTSTPVSLVCSYFEEIDESGMPTGLVKKEVVFTPDESLPAGRWRCGATGACAAYDRMIYDKYGPLDHRVVSEDWVLSFRAWLESGIGLVESALVQHRTHAGCLSVKQRNIMKQRDPREREALRRRGASDVLARHMEWLRAWTLSGRSGAGRVAEELRREIELSALRCRGLESDRLGALGAALKAASFPRGYRVALAILLRGVLGIH